MACFKHSILVALLFSSFPKELKAQSLQIKTYPSSPYYVKSGNNLTLDITYNYNGTDSIISVVWNKLPGPVLVFRRFFGTITRGDTRASLKDNVSLVLKNVEEKDNGAFEVLLLASDTADTPRTTITVIVQAQPTANANCSNVISVKEGETISCLCNSTGGNPSPIASWSKNGARISGPGKLKTILLLKNVSKDDSGNYSCMVGSIDLQDAIIINVKVKYQPSIISFKTDQRNGLFVNSGVSITITCKADAYPATRYFISHNGILLVKFYGVLDGVYYTIISVKLSDAGEYTCRVTNEIGSASKKLVLIVKEKPKAQATCPSTTVRESSYVTCVCKSISGQPTPTATWIKDGSNDVINGTSNSSQMLVFSSIKRTDNGKYWCKVENSVSFDNVSVNIIVHYKPKFIPIPPILSFATLGSMFNMTFFADGNPPPKLTLSHNGTILMETGGSKTLIINSISYNDSGVYECRAQNIVGEERRSTYLVVTADTKTDCSGTDKLNNENCKSYWYISVITLFCGILIGAVVTYVTPRIRHRRSRNKESVPPAEYAIPSTSTEEKRNNPVYQELNLQDMNKGDNYQALKRSTKSGRSNEAVVENEAAYQELNKVREKGDDNYQSLNRA